MSLPPPPVQRSLFDVENLLGRQFDPSDRFRLFRERVYPRLLAARAELEEALAGMKEAERPAPPAWWAAVWERYVQSKLDYHAEAPELAQKMDQAGRDAWELLRWLEGLGQALAPGQALAKGEKAL